MSDQSSRNVVVDAIQDARQRMAQELPGTDRWWVAYYDLRKAEILLV